MQDRLPAEVRTVDGIRRLMAQLCEGLEGLAEGVSLAAPDTVRALLAVRKEIVPVLDERLVKCAELIQRGLRDEACSYALEPPDLLQAATLVDVSQHPRWKIWSAELTKLQIPAVIMPRMDLVATLVKAQDELIQLKPLLDAWRRMNLGNAPLAKRIAMLGKLRQADPENEVWFKALLEHERRRVPVLEQEVVAAVKARDDQRLSELIAEMQRQWIEPVPKRILLTAKNASATFREERINRELDSLSESLAAAHESRDLDAACTLRDRWRELADDKGSFAVDDRRLVLALPAVEWVDAHARMATVFEELWSSLDSRPDSVRMRQEWVRSLERLGNEMEDLAERLHGEADVEAIERAHDRIGRQRLQLDRDLRFRRMTMYVSIASSAIVLGLAVWYLDDRARLDRRVEAALGQLRETREKVASGLLQDMPDFERTWSPRIAGNEAVAGLLSIVRGELDQHNVRRTRLATALGQAQDSLRAAEEDARPDPFAAWPPAFAEASRSLEEIDASSLASTDQERADVTRTTSSLDRLGKRFMAAADAVCRERISAFDADLDRARDLVSSDGSAAMKIVEAVRSSVADLRSQAAAQAVADASASHMTLRVASSPIVSLLSPDGPLLRKAESIEGLRDSREKFREAIAELDERLGDWERYSQQLEAIAQGFSAFPESRDYARAAESKSQWPAVDAWRSYQPCLQGLHLAAPERAREVLAKFEALPVEAKNLPTAKRFVQDLMPAVKQLGVRDMDSLNADLESCFSDTWLGELRFVVKTDESSALYYCLDGQTQGSPTFTFVTGRKDAEAGWPTKLERKTVASVAQSPQSRLADRLRDAVRGASAKGGSGLDQLLVGLIETVITARDVDPIPRLVTARKLLLLAETNSRPCRESGRHLYALVNNDQGEIPGLSVNQLWSFVPPTRDLDGEYKVTRQRSEAILAAIDRGLPEIKRAIEKERQLLASPPTSWAVLAGRVGRKDTGELTAVWRKAPPQPGPVWWFPAGVDAVVAGTVDDTGTFYPQHAAASAGTPLFTMASQNQGAKERAIPTGER